MTDRENEVLKKITGVLKNNLAPGKIILFGSRARQNFSKGSDFDLAVDAEKIAVRQERRIKEEIESVSGLYKVDIVFLNSIDKDFREIILRTGKIVYERGD